MKNSILLKSIRSFTLFTLVAIACATPASAAPYIFNSTESAGPGELVSIQGDNYLAGGGTTATVWFHVVSGTETSLTTPNQSDPTFVALSGSNGYFASVGNQQITLNLPVNVPMGLYALWVEDSSGNFSPPALVNLARPMQFEFGEVPPSYTFRIFGRNLCLAGKTPLVTFTSVAGTYTGSATVSGTYPNDAYVLQVQAPSNLPTSGTYNVLVSNGYGHGTGNFDSGTSEQTIQGRTGGPGLAYDPLNLGVPWGYDFTNIAAHQINVVTSINPHTGAPYGADSTGGTNAINIIQQALYDAGNSNIFPQGATVFLPSGTFLINNIGENTTFPGTSVESSGSYSGSGTNVIIDQPMYAELILPSNVVLTGSIGSGGTLLTTIHDATNGMPYPNRGIATPFGKNSSYLGVMNLNWVGSGTVISGTYGAPVINVDGTDAFCSNLNVAFAFSPAPGDGGGLGIGGFHNALAQNITLDHGSFGGDAGTGGAGYFIFRNNILNHHGGAPTTRIDIGEFSKNFLYENNIATRDGDWPGNAQQCWNQGGIENDGAVYETILNNTFSAYSTSGTALPLEQNNDGETINAQGQPPQYDYDLVNGACTSTTLVDTTRNWTVNAFAGQIVSIINGPGMGQWRKIASNTATTISLDPTQLKPTWTEIPVSGSSTYSLNGEEIQKSLIKGNLIADQPRGIALYLGSYDCAVVNNTVVDTAESIYIRSDQRPLSSGTWYGRMSPSWHDLVADNAVVGTATSSGTWAANISAALYQNSGSNAATDALAGSIILNPEFRRNVLVAHVPNLLETDIDVHEGYNNLDVQGYYSSFPGILGSVFDDNETINSGTYAYFNFNTWQPSIWNELSLNASGTSAISINGAVDASEGGNTEFFEADFSGTGASTGGAADMVFIGATGSIVAGSGQDSAAIVSSTDSPFTSGTGTYLAVTTGTVGSSGACVQFNPSTSRTSWGRIFDYRSVVWQSGTYRTGHWQVNGAFDYFWSPVETPSLGNYMRPIDITNGGSGNGLRLTFHNTGSTTIEHEVVTGSGGGGVDISGTYTPGFVAGGVYHLGVTYSTNPSTGVTTAKLFAVSGTGAIITSGSGAAAPIGSGSFTLNAATVTNTTGYLSTSGTWQFGNGAYGDGGAVHTNDYDCLRFYSQDPGVFPACKP